jgi:hypothetical protein
MQWREWVLATARSTVRLYSILQARQVAMVAMVPMAWAMQCQQRKGPE